jgi:hypothetical protein
MINLLFLLFSVFIYPGSEESVFFFLFFLMWWNATPLTIENEIIEAWKESLLICLFYSDLMLVKWVKLSLVCWDLVGGKNEFGSAIDY